MAITTTWSRRTADVVMRRLPVVAERWDYQWGVLLKGIEDVWRATGDARYFEYIKSNFDLFVGPDGSIATYKKDDYNIDFINPGKLLFALHRETRDERYRRAIETLRAQLRAQPRTPSGGFWHKQVYPVQMWLDGIYMGSPFLAQYAATFDEPDAFADVVHQIALIFEHTRDPQSGLLYHGWAESRSEAWADPKTGCSRSFWARAVGWYAMALADVLDILPDPAHRATVGSIFRETMEPLARVQDQSGVWWQVLDQPDRAGNYLESSASCMFAYAFAKGARQGYLPAEHRRIASRAYDAIIERFIHTSDGNIDVSGCCRGAGLGPGPAGKPYRDGSFEYYIGEPVVTNDHKAVGAFLLASVELERG